MKDFKKYKKELSNKENKSLIKDKADKGNLNYGGFFIEKALGNNKFSYEDRELKKIYVPSLIDGGFSDISIGVEASFVEVDEGVEKHCIGLENMYHLVGQGIAEGKDIYLFDNHNHSFYFWCKALKENKFKKGVRLVHIDQHKDTREAENYDVDIDDIEDVKKYTNEVLNVGSFIKPALYHNIFDDVDIVDSTYSMEKEIAAEYVLDIDLDFFSKDMDYIDLDWKLDKVSEYIQGADVITIATSPFFIGQERAIDVLKMLFAIEKRHNL
ncbi:MAG: UPF0489 family protein [Peptostreptococcus sp.]|uniref:UPF0489 family protein n=1 Tax=Peptostreptococcus sp. TaxID=1262 RepID=UPI002FC9E797